MVKVDVGAEAAETVDIGVVEEAKVKAAAVETGQALAEAVIAAAVEAAEVQARGGEGVTSP